MDRSLWIGGALAVAALGLTACPLGDDTGASGDAQWFLTCGDPVCQGYTGPFDGVALCTSEAAGDACADVGTECDPEDDCNARLRCATEDPTQQEGGCPISLSRYKHDVHHLTPGELLAIEAELRAMKLSTWRYDWDDAAVPPHLGFVIDEHAGSPAVRPDGEHVDLYGFTTMAVAALQVQSARIEALEAEVRALRAERGAGAP